MVRIVLADDHSMLRRSLANLLNEHPGFIVVGEAADGDQALASALEHQPDIILLDLNMPRRGGLDVLPELRSRIPRMRVLVLTGRDEEFYIMQALKLGAHGYMLKSADETDLISAIQRVASGNMMLGSGVAEKVISGALRDSPALTDAERRLMLLVAAGFDNEQIADRMQIDLADVIEGLATSMDKLDARDRYAAALTAVRRGFVPLEELQSIR
jgi:DNA-binding NarL/FixJ family response regulator